MLKGSIDQCHPNHYAAKLWMVEDLKYIDNEHWYFHPLQFSEVLLHVL